MFKTQIYLTKEEKEKLILLSQELGKHQSALIRDAIDQFIESNPVTKRKRHQTLRAAAGLWADRKDLPNFNDL